MSKRKDIRRDQIETAAPAADATAAASPTISPEEIVIAPAPAPKPAATAETHAFSMPEIELAAPRPSAASDSLKADRPIAPLAETPSASKRFPLLAASVALAAAVGAVLGSVASMGLANSVAPATSADARLAEVTRSLQGVLTQVNADVAALKASIDASSRAANTQLGKIGERLDRSERAQAEPTAKLSTIVDSLARLEHRTAAAPAPDVTGSVADNRPAASPAAQEPPKPVVLEGWVLRETYRGRALVENRDVLYEVSAGSNLPGVGRIEKIMQQNGRWVVVTPKGLILSMR
jgi:hypothetical protein